MRPLPGYDIGVGNILEVRRNLYGSVEASRKFFLLAKHVYTTKAGLRQLHSDPCVFVRYEWNVKGEKGPEGCVSGCCGKGRTDLSRSGRHAQLVPGSPLPI